MRVLAIDIGGTKSALALCTFSGGLRVEVTLLETFRSSDFKSLIVMIEQWRSLHPTASFDAVGAGVAGPVAKGRVHLTNLGWDINADDVSNDLGVPCKICNDMEAHGWGLLGLQGEQVEVLNPGNPRSGPKALVAAGTGLGEAIVGFDGRSHFPMPGEGGHASFSPCSKLEIELLEFLLTNREAHVSWERVLGGLDGFRNLANFMAQQRDESLPSYLQQVEKDWGAPLATAASQGDKFANEVLSFYALLYGREAGNLALKSLCIGGLYLGGGIAPKIIPWLKAEFMNGFLDKGRFSSLLQKIPVYIVTDSLNGLRGAAIQFKNDQTHR